MNCKSSLILVLLAVVFTLPLAGCYVPESAGDACDFVPERDVMAQKYRELRQREYDELMHVLLTTTSVDRFDEMEDVFWRAGFRWPDNADSLRQEARKREIAYHHKQLLAAKGKGFDEWFKQMRKKDIEPPGNLKYLKLEADYRCAEELAWDLVNQSYCRRGGFENFKEDVTRIIQLGFVGLLPDSLDARRLSALDQEVVYWQNVMNDPRSRTDLWDAERALKRLCWKRRNLGEKNSS